MREYGVPPIAAIPDRGSLLDPLAERAQAHPHSTAVRVNRLGRWAPVTYEQLFAEARTIAKGIAASGVQPGDRIAIASRNRAEWLVAEYAIWHAGAISVAIPPSAPRGTAEWILADSGAVAVFAGTAGQGERFRETAHQLPGVRHVWVIDEGALWSLAESGQIVGDDDLDLRRGTLDPGSAATISYASQGSQRGAGCVLTHGGIGYLVETLAGCLPDVWDSEASLLLALPLHDTFGRILQLAAIRAGVPSGVCDGLDLVEDLGGFRPTGIVTSADLLTAIIERARVNAHRSGLGRVFDRAVTCAVRFGASPGEPGPPLRLEHAAFGPLVYRNLRADLGGRLDFILLNGSSPDPELEAFFAGLGLRVLRGHGTAEASGASHVNLPGAARAGSVGRPLPGITTRITSDGDVLVRGPGLFDGYWNNTAATIEVLDADGWLATGDAGLLDEDGYLYLHGGEDPTAAHPARRAAGSARG